MAEYRYYLIPDFMSHVFPQQFEEQAPTEFFSNTADLMKRYKQLREMPYNNEYTWNERTNLPYPRLTVGIDRRDPDGAVTIMQVRNGINYLCDDYRGPFADRNDKQLIEMAKQLVTAVGVDRIRPHYYTEENGHTKVHVSKDIHITEWTNAPELCSALRFSRFLNRDGQQLFQVRNGQRIIENYADGSQLVKDVQTVDDTHFYVGSRFCHIQQYANQCFKRGCYVEPEHPQPGDKLDRLLIYQIPHYTCEYRFTDYDYAQNKGCPPYTYTNTSLVSADQCIPGDHYGNQYRIGAWPVLLLAVLASIAAVIINYLVTHWDEIKQNFSQTLADLAQALNTAGENLQHIWDTLWLTIKLIGLQIWESITTGWSNFWKGIDLALRMAGAALQAAWSACWLIIKLAAMQIWEDVTTAWSNFWKGLSLLLSMAGAALNAVWTAAWSALADTVSSIWDGVTSVVRGAVNGIIRIINGMISAIVSGMNAVIGLLNGFSFDVPEFAQDALGTAKIGFNIDPITAPQIPYLAQGAVIPANHEFLAVLGDQTNGTNVEAPLETIQQALAEVLAEWGGQDITIRFAASGGLEQLVRLLMPYIDKEKARRGARLVVGGN